MEAPASPKSLRVLYLFAGLPRKADIGFWLRELAPDGAEASVEEFDLQRSEQDDITDDSLWFRILSKIQSGLYHVLITSPPCNTWSRAKFRGSGPRPERSRDHPWGLPSLLPGSLDKQRCDTGSLLLQRSLEACTAADIVGTRWLLEHPEDLGATTSGVPASIWALEVTRALISNSHAETVAIHQCSYGSQTSKPTRLAGTLGNLALLGYPGWPRLAPKTFRYLGPLPHRCSCRKKHQPLLGKDSMGNWRTAPSASYPSLMCKLIAQRCWDTYRAAPSVGAIDDHNQPDAREDSPVKQSRRYSLAPLITSVNEALQTYIDTSKDRSPPPQQGGNIPSSSSEGSEADESGLPILRKGTGIRGHGAPLRFRNKDYEDGCGLCSPGRWPPDRRNLEQSGIAESLRTHLLNLLHKTLDIKKVTYGLCCGHFKTSPFTEELLQAGRDILLSLLQEHGATDLGSISTSAASPVALQAIHDLLRLCGDPDYRIFGPLPGGFQQGVPLGVDEKLPRAAALYKAKLKRRPLSDDEDGADPRSRDNYISVKNNKKAVRDQFELEEELEAMAKMPEDKAIQQLGPGLVVAAVGAIEKADSSFRVIHDGTHDVKVNNRIVVRDLCGNPGHRELKVHNELSQNKGSSLGLVGDVKRAHRIPKVRASDWKFQCCTLDDRDERGVRILWLNLVGTFGISSASYWWSRMGGALGRSSIYITGRQWLMQLLYVDDFEWHATGPAAHESLLLVIFWLTVAGVPFSWKKFRGGLELDYVGYWTCLDLRLVGLSEGRADWIRKWIARILAAGRVHTGEFAQVLGRLSFGFSAVDLLRPFLGPCYAWSSAVPDCYVLDVPPMVQLVLRFLDRALASGYRAEPMSKYDQHQLDSFRADAKAEGDKVVLGGYVTRADGRLDLTPWFSETLDRISAPWVYERGEPFRVIASLELLATLGCVRAFIPSMAEGALSTLTLTGITDNMGNSQLLSKLGSTKFPLVAVLMELAAVLLQKRTRLCLAWAPRLQNSEADALTNYDFSLFDSGRRVRVDFSESNRGLVMGDMLDSGRALFKSIEEAKVKKAKVRSADRARTSGWTKRSRISKAPLPAW